MTNRPADYPLWLRWCAFLIMNGTIIGTLLIFDRPKPVLAYFVLPASLGLGAVLAWLIRLHDRKRRRRWW
jgi:hypothetical protein